MVLPVGAAYQSAVSVRGRRLQPDAVQFCSSRCCCCVAEAGLRVPCYRLVLHHQTVCPCPALSRLCLLSTGTDSVEAEVVDLWVSYDRLLSEELMRQSVTTLSVVIRVRRWVSLIRNQDIIRSLICLIVCVNACICTSHEVNEGILASAAFTIVLSHRLLVAESARSRYGRQCVRSVHWERVGDCVLRQGWCIVWWWI